MCNFIILESCRLEGVPCVKPQIARLRTHSFIKPDPSNPKKGGLGRSQYAHIWAKGSELDIIWPCLGMKNLKAFKKYMFCRLSYGIVKLLSLRMDNILETGLPC